MADTPRRLEFIVDFDASRLPLSSDVMLGRLQMLMRDGMIVAEVVRCRDCRHAMISQIEGVYDCNLGMYCAEDDGFCKWGERHA